MEVDLGELKEKIRTLRKKDLDSWTTEDTFFFLKHHFPEPDDLEYLNIFKNERVRGKTLLTFKKKENIASYNIPKGIVDAMFPLILSVIEEQESLLAAQNQPPRDPPSLQNPILKRYKKGLVECFSPSNHTRKNCMAVQTGSDPPYLNGRPSSNVGLPLSLAHQCIGSLIERFKTTQPQRRDIQFAEKFRNCMAGWFSGEDKRQAEAMARLHAFYGVTVEGSRINPKSISAMDLFVGNMDKLAPLLQMVIEIENEIGSTDSLKYFQGTAYYRDFVVELCNAPVVMETCAPTILMELCGPQVRFSIVALLDKICQEPLTHFINLLPFNQNGQYEELVELAKVFRATKDWMAEEQRALWKSATGQISERLPALQIALPYPLGFPTNDFSLQTRLGGRFDDIKNMRTGNEATPLFSANWWKDGADEGGIKIVNKYARLYPIDIHDQLSKMEGEPLVPKLYGAWELAGKWVCVVMESLDDGDGWRCLGNLVQGSAEWKAGEESVKRLLQVLQERRFRGKKLVHGDIRAGNIFVNKSGQARLVDLDWMGTEGEARYPNLLNHDDIWWADGVTEGGIILQEHDRVMVERLGKERPSSYAWVTDV